MSAAAVNRDRIFLAANQAFVGEPGSPEGPSMLLHLSGTRSTKLDLRSIELPARGIAGVLAHGKKALLYSGSREPRVLVVDTEHLDDARIVQNVEFPGDVTHVLIEDDAAICALGDLGTTVVPLR